MVTINYQERHQRQSSSPKSKPNRQRQPRRRGFGVVLDGLEDRVLLAAFPVTTQIDNGPTSPGTLSNVVGVAMAAGSGNIVDYGNGVQSSTELQGIPTVEVDTTLTIYPANGTVASNGAIVGNGGSNVPLFNVGAGGSLTLQSCDLTNISISVAQGGVLNILDSTLNDSLITVDGGIISVSETAIQNTPAGSYAITVSNGSLTMQTVTGTKNQGGCVSTTDCQTSIAGSQLVGNIGPTTVLLSFVGGQTTLTGDMLLTNTVAMVVSSSLASGDVLTISTTEINTNTISGSDVNVTFNGGGQANLSQVTIGATASDTNSTPVALAGYGTGGVLSVDHATIVYNAADGIDDVTAGNMLVLTNSGVYYNTGDNIVDGPNQAILTGSNDDGTGSIATLPASFDAAPEITTVPDPTSQLYLVDPGSPWIGAGTNDSTIGATSLLVGGGGGGGGGGGNGAAGTEVVGTEVVGRRQRERRWWRWWRWYDNTTSTGLRRCDSDRWVVGCGGKRALDGEPVRRHPRHRSIPVMGQRNQGNRSGFAGQRGRGGQFE